MQRFLKSADQTLHAVETACLSLCFTGMMGTVIAQGVLQSVFHTALPWASGLAKHLLVCVTLVGAVAAVRDGRHISLEALPRVLPPSVRRWVMAAAHALSAAACGAGVMMGMEFYYSLRSNKGAELVAPHLPVWVFHLALPVAAGLLALRFLLLFLRDVTGEAPDASAGEIS